MAPRRNFGPAFNVIGEHLTSAPFTAVSRVSLLPDDHQFVFVECIDENYIQFLFRYDTITQLWLRIELVVKQFLFYHPLTSNSGYYARHQAAEKIVYVTYTDKGETTEWPYNPITGFIIPINESTYAENGQGDDDPVNQQNEQAEVPVNFDRQNIVLNGMWMRPSAKIVCEAGVERLSMFRQDSLSSCSYFGYESINKTPVFFETLKAIRSDHYVVFNYCARIGNKLYNVHSNRGYFLATTNLDTMQQEILDVDCSYFKKYLPTRHFPLSVHGTCLFMVCRKVGSKPTEFNIMYINVNAKKPKWRVSNGPNNGRANSFAMAFHSDGTGIAVSHDGSPYARNRSTLNFYRVWSDRKLMSLESIARDRLFQQLYTSKDIINFGVIKVPDSRFPNFFKKLRLKEEQRRKRIEQK